MSSLACIDSVHRPKANRDVLGRLLGPMDIMRLFRAASAAQAIGKLERAWHALAVTMLPIPLASQWTPEAAGVTVREALREARLILEDELSANTELHDQFNRTLQRCQSSDPRMTPVAITALQDLSHSILTTMSREMFLCLSEQETKDYTDPLARFSASAAKFPQANEAMTAAVQCYALGQWDAAVFHAMRVLEQGLRWLAARVDAGPFPLTLKRPVELENWESIIGNIQTQIEAELKAHKTRTLERDEELAFLSRAASEFRYFKEAWRNHVMHTRNVPYDVGTAGSALEHVATFMRILAEKA